MKTPLTHFTMFFMILMLGLAGCANQMSQSVPTQVPVPTATVKPISTVVLDMVERMNAGDADGTLAYWADDAVVYFVGMPPTGMEIYRGKEQFRPVWEECITSHFKWEVEIVSVVGDVVNVHARTWHDFTRQLGVAPNEFTDVYVIRDGKIVTYESTITEKALARFKPALAAVMPPEPTAAPSSDLPVSEMRVTISDGTCSYEGPMALKAGAVHVITDVKDQDKIYGLTFFTLDPGKDLVDLMALTVSPVPPPWSKMIAFWEFGPGENQSHTLNVQQGPVYLICWSKPPEFVIGNVGPFEVK